MRLETQILSGIGVKADPPAPIRTSRHIVSNNLQRQPLMNIVSTHAADLIDAPDLAIATGSGRATWDERGNSIWEWQTAPGVYSREINSQQLQALEACELTLQEGVARGHEVSLWSHNARNTASRIKRTAKSSGFDIFLKGLGLSA
jgi:hypothetical protein